MLLPQQFSHGVFSKDSPPRLISTVQDFFTTLLVMPSMSRLISSLMGILGYLRLSRPSIFAPVALSTASYRSLITMGFMSTVEAPASRSFAAWASSCT
jgi:hypothetical protein